MVIEVNASVRRYLSFPKEPPAKELFSPSSVPWCYLIDIYQLIIKESVYLGFGLRQSLRCYLLE